MYPETLKLGRYWMRALRLIQRTPLRIRRALVFVEGQGQAHRKASYPQRLWHLLLFHLAQVQLHKGLPSKSNLLLRQNHPSIRLLMFPQNQPECWKTSSLPRAAHHLLLYLVPLIPHCPARQPISHYQARLHPFLPLKVGSRLSQLYPLRGDQVL
jgi:hypothetical protein